MKKGWRGDSHRHSLAAKGIKSGRKTYHRPYVPKFDERLKRDKYISQGNTRCPLCNVPMSGEGDAWYCQRCNELWTKGRLEGYAKRYHKGDDQYFREANWILSNMRKLETERFDGKKIGNTLVYPKKQEWEKWHKKWENWSNAHPELVSAAKNRYGTPKKTFYDRRTGRILRKRYFKKDGHKIYF